MGYWNAMKRNELTGYAFDSPLLVTERELVSLPAEAWQSGEHWAEALKNIQDAIVKPTWKA